MHCGVELEVLNEPECIRLMKAYIEQHPEIWYEDIGEPA